MIRPKYLKVNDIIGVTAVSDGVNEKEDINRFNNAEKNLNEKGYKVCFTENVFTADETGRSSDASTRIKQFDSLISNKDVSYIVAAKGGNFLNEMMPMVDFDKIKQNPKWYQGYSDNTWLTYTITTKCDMMTIYGNNFGDYGMDIWHRSVSDNLEILEGNNIIQKSYDKYQENFGERITGLEGYNLDSDVIVKCENGNGTEFSGRLLGGCLDVLVYIQGTKYDNTEAFIEKYKEDGIIWYLETFDFAGENLMMFLWKLKECGWFKYTKGFVFGRPLFFREGLGMNYEEAVKYALGDINVPIVFDTDIGHRGPRFTIVNGAKARVCYNNKKISLEIVEE